MKRLTAPNTRPEGQQDYYLGGEADKLMGIGENSPWMENPMRQKRDEEKDQNEDK